MLLQIVPFARNVGNHFLRRSSTAPSPLCAKRNSASRRTRHRLHARRGAGDNSLAPVTSISPHLSRPFSNKLINRMAFLQMKRRPKRRVWATKNPLRTRINCHAPDAVSGDIEGKRNRAKNILEQTCLSGLTERARIFRNEKPNYSCRRQRFSRPRLGANPLGKKLRSDRAQPRGSSVGRVRHVQWYGSQHRQVDQVPRWSEGDCEPCRRKSELSLHLQEWSRVIDPASIPSAFLARRSNSAGRRPEFLSNPALSPFTEMPAINGAMKVTARDRIFRRCW